VALGFLLGMPLVFMLIFGFAFSEEHMSKSHIGVVDKDKTSTSRAFIKVLNEIEDLEVSSHRDTSKALKELKDGELLCFFLIPKGFGSAVEENRRGGKMKISLKVTYDETKQWLPEQAIAIVEGVALKFMGTENPLNLKRQGIKPEAKPEFLHFLVPGIVIFGLMILIPTLARTIVADKEKGFLPRLFTTPTRSVDFLLGYSLPMILVTVILVIIYLVVAFLMGLKVYGNLALAFIFFFLIGVCCIGFAMTIGAFAKSEAQAEPVCWIFLVPMAMLSGAWFPIENLHPIMMNFAKTFPFYYALEASRRIITTGAEFNMVSTEFLIVLGWAVLSFLMGTIAFRRGIGFD